MLFFDLILVFFFLLSQALFFKIEVLLIYNVVFVSGLWQSDSVLHTHTHTHTHILFPILFSYRLLQNIEYSSLCCTVGPCCLSILCLVVCIFDLTP